MRKCFKPSLIRSLLILLITGCLVGLGFWQLHRANEKKELLKLAGQQARKTSIVWSQALPAPQLFQRIILQGHYLPYTLLLDNQHSEHLWGYHVVNPLLLATGEVVLVDRGWVLGDLRRAVLPAIAIPKGPVVISGQAYYPSSKGFVLGEIFEPHGPLVGVIERLDTKLISNILHKRVYPFIIRLDKRGAEGYVRDWKIVAMSPQRHNAYAFQWFAMAFVLVIIFVALSFKKID